MPRQPVTIDRDKLRATVRELGHEHVFYMLDDAIDLLPPAKLHQIAKKYLDLKSLRPDSEVKEKANLLAAVKAFDKMSRAGEYYESFTVNSKNYMEQSKGTTAFIAEYRRLLDRCVAEEKKVKPAEAREAFDILFGLLDYIDECNDDVVFFADEGGSWQVGVDWDRVLPSWFRVLSATVAPGEYADRITAPSSVTTTTAATRCSSSPERPRHRSSAKPGWCAGQASTPAPWRNEAMSKYQYYEFQAIDRPLTAKEAGSDGPLGWAPNFPAEESCHAVAELIGSCPPKVRGATRNRLIEALGGLVRSWEEMITRAADRAMNNR